MSQLGETTTWGRSHTDRRAILAVIFSTVLAVALPSSADIIADDLFVQGGVCAGEGGSCDGTETFGGADLLLEDATPSIRFLDTSASATSDNDWAISTDDRFIVRDETGAVSPLQIEPGARDESIWIDDLSTVGINGEPFAHQLFTPPLQGLEVYSDSAPFVTLTGSQLGPFASGLFAQTTGFGLLQTNTSFAGINTPIFVARDAGTTSLGIDEFGNTLLDTLGVGDAFNESMFDADPVLPEATLHVLQAGGNPEVVLVENDGDARMTFLNADNGESWQTGIVNSRQFFVDTTLTGNTDFVIFPDGNVQFGSFFKLTPSGNLKITGKLTEGSSRTTKENFAEVDGGEVLALLGELPISRWSYKDDADGTTHLGPMAEDFHAAFGLGEDAQHLAPMDAAAVALVAIQEQQEMLREKDRQIDALQKRLAALEGLVSRELEARPAGLAR